MIMSGANVSQIEKRLFVHMDANQNDSIEVNAPGGSFIAIAKIVRDCITHIRLNVYTLGIRRLEFIVCVRCAQVYTPVEFSKKNKNRTINVQLNGM